MSKDNTFSRYSDTETGPRTDEVLDAVEQIMRSIEVGFHTNDRSVSRVTVERTNDGHGWAVKYGTDYGKES